MMSQSTNTIVIDDEEPHLPLQSGVEPTSDAQNNNQIVITIMESGEVQVAGSDGKVFVVNKEILQQQGIDSNNLGEDDVRFLLQLTLDSARAIDESQQQMNSPTENNDGNGNHSAENQQDVANPGAIAQSNRKRRMKQIFDPSVPPTLKKQRYPVQFHPYPYQPQPMKKEVLRKNITLPLDSADNALNGAKRASSIPSFRTFLSLAKANGATIYQPKKPHTANGKNATVPRFCCAVCEKPIPKTKVDFVLLRLPAHGHCANGTRMHLSDSEEGDDDANNADENEKAEASVGN